MVAVQGANMDFDLVGQGEGRTEFCAYWLDAEMCSVHRCEPEMEVDSVSLM